MRVTAFRLRNFMGFQDSGWLELQQINLLFGRNSAGKSAIFRALLLLKQSLDAPPNGEPFLMAADGGVDVGTYRTIVNGHEIERDITFGFKCEIPIDPLAALMVETDSTPEIPYLFFYLRYGLDQNAKYVCLKNLLIKSPPFLRAGPGDQLVQRVTVFEATLDTATWYFQTDFPDIFAKEEGENVWSDVEVGLEHGFLPVLKLPDATFRSNRQWGQGYKYVTGVLDALNDDVVNFIKPLEYFGPIRRSPERFYYSPGNMNDDRLERSLAMIRRYAASHDTGQSARKIAAVDSWLRRLGFEAELAVQPLGRLDELWRYLQAQATVDLWGPALPNLSEYLHGRSSSIPLHEVTLTETSGLEVNLRDVGFGISQVLPLVMACVLAEQSDERPTMIIIEQPELHLHPRAQADLADLIIETVSTRNVRFFIETHSEHLLLRFRRRLAQAKLRSLQQSEEPAFGESASNMVNGERRKDFQLTAYFIERKDSISRMEVIQIDAFGQFAVQPDGFRDFFSEDFEQSLAMARDVAEAKRLAQQYAGHKLEPR